MTRQQAGVGAEAVAKLVEKWREYVMKMSHGKDILVEPSSKELVDLQVEMAERFLADLSALATAPPEQGIGVAQEEAQLLARYDKGLQDQPQATSSGALSAEADELNQCLQIILTNAGNIKADRNGPILEQCIAIEDAVKRAAKVTWAALAASGGALDELVAKWRKRVEYHSEMGEAGEHLAVGEVECADELEAALAAHDQKVRADTLETAAREFEDGTKWFGSVPTRTIAAAIRSLAAPAPAASKPEAGSKRGGE